MEKVFYIFANDITCQTVVYRPDSCLLSFGIMLLSSEVRRFLLSSKSVPVIALGWMYSHYSRCGVCSYLGISFIVDYVCTTGMRTSFWCAVIFPTIFLHYVLFCRQPKVRSCFLPRIVTLVHFTEYFQI